MFSLMVEEDPWGREEEGMILVARSRADAGEKSWMASADSEEKIELAGGGGRPVAGRSSP